MAVASLDLKVPNVRLEDTGTYKCVARDILGREEKRTSLVVESKYVSKSTVL